MVAFDNIISDIQKLQCAGRIAASERDRLVTEATRVRRHYAIESELLEARFLRRWRVLARTAASAHPFDAMRFAPRGLPHPVYRALYMLREKWRELRVKGIRLPAEVAQACFLLAYSSGDAR